MGIKLNCRDGNKRKMYFQQTHMTKVSDYDIKTCAINLRIYRMQTYY